MTTKHTPGPWFAYNTGHPNMASVSFSVAPTRSGFDVAENIRHADDAHLIAAAPDLAEALERMIARHGRDVGGGACPDCEAARAALRKAGVL